jgi:predicted DNA-binding protein with PD1-like motif
MKYFLIGFLFTSFAVAGQKNQADSCRYTKVASGYLVVLRQGDTVFHQLEKIAEKEKIPAANFSGMGFLSHVRFGFFNQSTKDFDPKDFTNVELASLTGSIAWEEGKVSLHLHGVAGDNKMQAYAGHILSAVVGTGSLEIVIISHDQKMERKMDPAISAKVLQLPCRNKN